MAGIGAAWPPSRAEQERAVHAWNERHPVGASVRVRTDTRGTIETRTRSRAQMLSGHTAVVWLEGIAGCYALDRVRATTEAIEALERR